MIKAIDVSTQKPLSDLVSLARSGADVVLTDGKTPLFRLVPIDAHEMGSLESSNGSTQETDGKSAAATQLSQGEPYLVEKDGFLLLNGTNAEPVDWDGLVDRVREERLCGFGAR